SLFYFGRNDALNAAEFFANKRGLGKDKLRRNDYGGSLGGPIIKDRIFFFGSLEWNKEIRGKSRSGSVPTLAERTGDFTNRRVRSDGFACDGPALGSGPGAATQIIPTASQSAAGQTLVKIFPAPNLAWSPTSGTCDNW